MAQLCSSFTSLSQRKKQPIIRIASHTFDYTHYITTNATKTRHILRQKHDIKHDMIFKNQIAVQALILLSFCLIHVIIKAIIFLNQNVNQNFALFTSQ
nr:MAG TPA: hypothetical protein [Caudoviricetes sp.]